MEAHQIDQEKQSLMNILESLDLGSSEVFITFYDYIIFYKLLQFVIIFFQFDDTEFNIPKVNDIPTVESILNDEDVSLLSEDDVTVYQSKVNYMQSNYPL